MKHLPDGTFRFSPRDLVAYLDGDFSAWCERTQAERARAGGAGSAELEWVTPDEGDPEAELAARMGDEHERRYLERVREQHPTIVELDRADPDGAASTAGGPAGLRSRRPADLGTLARDPKRPRSRAACHEDVFRQRVPVHVRVRHRGPPGQDRRPDLRRRPRRRAARRPDRPRRLRDAREHRPGGRLGRDLDRRPTSTSRTIARETIRKIGYTDADLGFSADSCAVINAIDKQSPDIAQGVDTAYETRTDPSDDDELDIAGAGDQGMMFGYATRRDRRADAAADLARAQARASGSPTSARPRSSRYLRPDGKTQVTVRYRDGGPVEIEKLLISTQHREAPSR